VEPAPDDAQQALVFRVGDGKGRADEASHLAQQRPARTSDPARDGRAVDAVHRPELLHADAVDVIQAEQRALLGSQRSERLLQRLLERSLVTGPEIGQLRFRARGGESLQDLDVDGPLGRGTGRPVFIHREADRRHLEPPRDRAAPGICRDPRLRPAGAHEQPRSEQSEHFFGVGESDSGARQRSAHPPEVAALEHRHRLRISGCASEGEKQVGDGGGPQPDLGPDLLRGVRGQMASPGHHVHGERRPLHPRPLDGGDQGRLERVARLGALDAGRRSSRLEELRRKSLLRPHAVPYGLSSIRALAPELFGPSRYR